MSWTGITFSFFWKNHEVESRFAIASGGKVVSSGFSVYSNPHGGYVEFYTRGDSRTWKAHIKLPGICFECARVCSCVLLPVQDVESVEFKWFLGTCFALSLKPKKISHALQFTHTWTRFEIHSGLELHLWSDHKYFEYVIICIIILISSRCLKVLGSKDFSVNFAIGLVMSGSSLFLTLTRKKNVIEK